ncbi:hypothetical protein [Cyanobium sp. N5-Cardenillas]|uniref:hypothetical protein n=1 Tax=Cyanobium sp. N5-Cardenillas TaxID=2823720 RepID=UPI0020CFE0A6|nr:hypothetical protein [Cyanobium sp. N5-Cardenillas]MCP9787049.1 hypothetical protein [Cyanobium sp. N5-Cardenillas]
MVQSLLACHCGFSRIKPEKPHIAQAIPMEEPASLRLLQALVPAQQVEQLMAWLSAMAGQIPEADGRTPEQRAEEQAATNAAVLVV